MRVSKRCYTREKAREANQANENDEVSNEARGGRGITRQRGGRRGVKMNIKMKRKQ
jgi:hypothetical protein